jgi:hypothetical protein
MLCPTTLGRIDSHCGLAIRLWSDDEQLGSQFLQSGDFTSVRFSFAFLKDDERYGDVSPTICRPLAIEPKRAALAEPEANGSLVQK